MTNCQVVYPHRLVRPLKYKVDQKQELTLFLDDIKANHCKIKQFIADNLKRAIAKGCLNHASLFPCEYCFCKGIRYEGKNDEIKKTKLHFQKIKMKLSKIEEEEGQEGVRGIQSEIEKAEKTLRKKKRSHIVWPANTMNGG